MQVMSPAITVCVPVYNAEAFVEETLDSIARQSFSDIKVLMSLDRSTDDSASICRRYLRDPRFELIEQSDRLGWVANVNALIARVDTPYFCISPHDDLISPQYLESVYALAASDPVIACAYSDLEGFGALQIRIEQPEIRGPLFDRVIDFLLHHFAVVPFRGIIRRRDADDRPYVPRGLRGDFAADTVWMLHVVLRGELRRVPETLCAKRYHDASVHRGWPSWPREELIAAWAEQAAVCARVTLDGIEDPHEREIVVAAALMRVAGLGNSRTYATPRDPFEVAAATSLFCDQLGDAARVGNLPYVLASSKAAHLRAALAANAAEQSPAFMKRLWRRVTRVLAP
jgi:glycosyltransferase involved in cell wall biosynthesis